MKKYFLPLLALIAMPVVLTACSDDDDKTPTVSITTGQIPAKNVFVHINGEFIASAQSAGASTLSGNVDPTATEQHLQLTCPAMFIIEPTGNNTPPLEKTVPTFDITLRTADGKTTFSGESNIGLITVTGDVTVNHAGENDWRLFFVNNNSESRPCALTGKTFEIEFTDTDIYPQPRLLTTVNPDIDVQEMTKALFAKIPQAFVKNSGFTAARIAFVDNDHYEVSFRDGESGEWVKDETEHRYMTSTNRLYLIDEPGFKEKQAEFFNLKAVGLNYKCSPMGFAQQKLAYEVSSDREWCITLLQFRYLDGWDEAYFFIQNTNNFVFLQNWTLISDSSNPLDGEFGFITSLEKDNYMLVDATARLRLVE